MTTPRSRTGGSLWRRSLCALLLAVAWGGSARSSLGEDEKLTTQLQKIKADVESAEGEIARMKGEFNALLAKRAQLEESLKKIKDEDRAIQRKIFEMKERAVSLTAEVSASEKRAVEQQRKIQSRLKAMYINTSVSVSPVLSGKTARGDLERLSLYARKVRDFDSRLFKDASDAVAALTRSRSALESALSAEERLREQLAVKRKDAERESVKIKGVTDELVAKQKAAQESLALLQSEAKKVEEMIASLTSGDNDEDEVEESPHEEPVKDTTSGVVVPPPVAPKDLVYPSLFDVSAKGSAPVKGEVLQTFGRSKLTNFADMVRSKGIEFSTTEGSDVHVAQNGKVVFSGMMPGYDQVIVVEHGGRSYSLYGRLGTVAVKTGDIVERDHVIATTSAPDAKGRNFYFEIRKNGAPVDPGTVLVKVSR
jgi:septal ring factor EnvC (AmiA/AmiB activator)